MRYSMLCAVALAASACADNAGWSITEERTAAGVPHVINTPPALGIEPLWTIEPDVLIGSLEGGGPTSFGTIKGLVVLPDGRIAVLDAQAQELRIFGADGQHLSTFGRKGQGPGELDDANGLLLGNDGLLRVNDPRNSRLSFFHPDSGFVTSVPLDVNMFHYVWNAVIDTTNRVWERGLVLTSDQRSYVLKGYTPQGQWTDTIPQLEPVSTNRTPRGVYSWQRGNSSGMMQVPFWPSSRTTMDSRHFFWSKPSGENDYRIVRTTFTGDTTLIFESRRTAIALPQSARDSAIASIRKRTGSDFDWSQIPNEKPIVTQLFLASEGDVWVRVTAADDSLTTFDVFTGAGRYKGTAVTAMKVMPFLNPFVRGDEFWAVVTDELDVAYIARGRLAPRQ